MSRPYQLHLSALVAALIMSLAACNNLGLLDQLEKPGTATSGGAKTSALFLFATTNSFNGNIRSGMATARLAADVQCSTTRATLTFPDNACTQVRAMISLDAADSMANMPGNYGIPVNISVNGPNNFVIASDWGTLIAGTSGNSLVSGNAMPTSTNWWSFSTLGGNYDGTNNCAGGNDGTTGMGSGGNSNTSGNTWLSSGPISCPGPARLLCVCY